MSHFDYGNGRSTNISDQISDDELRDRIATLRGYDRLSQAQSGELRNYEHHLSVREAKRREERREQLRRGLRLDDPEWLARNTEPGSDRGPVDRNQTTDTSPGARARQLADRTLGEAVRSGRLPDHAAATVEAMLSRADADALNTAKWVNAAGQPAYASAFGKLLANPQRGHLTWTPEEAEAFRKVETYRSETRALGIATGGAGDYLVPMELDPAIMLTSSGVNSPLREIARTVQTTTMKWSGVTSAGATAEWKAEGAEAADGSPTFAQPVIDLHLYDVFVPFSYELELSAGDLRSQLQRVLADAAMSHTATAYTSGSGTGRPKGYITALGAASQVNAATLGILASGDVYALQNALPARWQAGASWVAAIATLNKIDQMETTNGSRLFPDLDNGRLLRHPVAEDSQLASGTGKVLAYGDFKAGFVIADRIGSTVELIPQVFGPNGRPTGQRGMFLYGATGSDVVVPAALRVLVV